MSQTYVKTPFSNVMNLLNVIPQGHEKALKQAFYNAVALFVLILCGAGGWALFYVLEPFVKPLVWALLIGSVLHPVKRSLARRLEASFHHLNASTTPFFLGLLMIPIRFVDEISDAIGNPIMNNIKFIVTGGLGVLSVFVFYSYTPCISIISYIWYINSNILLLIMNNLSITILSIFLIGYITILIFFWKDETKHLMSMSSYGMWLIISLSVAKVFGVLQIPLFLLILFALSFGFAFEVFTVLTLSCEKVSCWNAVKNVFEGHSMNLEDLKSHDGSALQSSSSSSSSSSSLVGAQDCDKRETLPQALSDKLVTTNPEVHKPTSTELINQERDSKENRKEERKLSQAKMPGLVRSSSDSMNKLNLYASIGQSLKTKGLRCNVNVEDPKAQCNESTMYIYAVVWACGLMMIWKNFWIVHFLPIPIAVYFVKNLGLYFGVWNLLHSQWSSLMESLMSFFKERELAIFPPPVRGLYKFAGKLRINMMNGIHYSINSFTSSLVILGLIFFTFCFTFFIMFQIYAEGIHLITVGAGIVNFTVVNNPEFHQLLPDGWGDKMESVINDAYVYGREGISKQVQHMLRDVDKAKSAELEKHILELWDRIYQAWLVGSVEPASTIGPKVTSDAVLSSWENFLGTFHRMPDLFNITAITGFAKENVGTLVSLMESLWILLKGNLWLIFQVVFATVSLVLGGGTVVLNFLISTIVFFTALFYLLSSSGARYKPVELLSNFSPMNGGKLGGAFEAAVNGVFKASFKMAVFYGLWTWLIHNIFQVRIVYLPSVLAAVLGAVPFLGTYWASIPAVLDLWLAQQKGVQAIILFVCHCLPISFVDTAIYREIKEGHPYMTGLAIAGGVFCMGIQGAIFGPILLCCLLVAINGSSNLMKESPSDPALTTISMHELRRDGKKDQTKPEEQTEKKKEERKAD